MEEKSYYERYRRQAILFEGIGIALLLGGILLNEATGRGMGAPVLILAGIGMVFLVIGGSSARPHTIIKSFAVLLEREPTRKNAEEFLTALTKTGKVSLVKSSENLVESALLAYGKSPEADEELLKELRESVDTRIKHLAF